MKFIEVLVGMKNNLVVLILLKFKAKEEKLGRATKNSVKLTSRLDRRHSFANDIDLGSKQDVIDNPNRNEEQFYIALYVDLVTGRRAAVKSLDLGDIHHYAPLTRHLHEPNHTKRPAGAIRIGVFRGIHTGDDVHVTHFIARFEGRQF